MVGLQAMVSGQLGRKPSPHPRACALSCPSPFAGRGSGLVGRVVPTDPPTTRPSLCPGPMKHGVSYVQVNGARVVHKKHNTHRAMTTPPAVLSLSGWAYAELRHETV